MLTQAILDGERASISGNRKKEKMNSDELRYIIDDLNEGPKGILKNSRKNSEVNLSKNKRNRRNGRGSKKLIDLTESG